MKIAITGTKYGLGKNIYEIFSKNYEIVSLNEPIQIYQNNICELIKECDVFINCEYFDTIQSILFEKVLNDWKYKNKTIVNILTSALVFGGTNKKYIEDKQNLESKTFYLRSDDKQVRIINIYPNTLESSKTIPYQKLNYSDVSNVIKFAIELPHDIELFEIGISKTKLKIENTLI